MNECRHKVPCSPLNDETNYHQNHNNEMSNFSLSSINLSFIFFAADIKVSFSFHKLFPKKHSNNYLIY